MFIHTFYPPLAKQHDGPGHSPAPPQLLVQGGVQEKVDSVQEALVKIGADDHLNITIWYLYLFPYLYLSSISRG